ncbi:hypothetical protein [Streptomyces anulatus]|nr:hypothetical protein [Streptomyces anulatus]MCX4486848.1 hypothetical protein [Streptomyces anulatus]MCX4523041.1 hypothetical protein [Streptomyces anulatus]MCX4606052.1 hypothetical protein [Streptomyces anulatus]WSI82038.1 hypothetical protein OG557_36165 [Streptomyces anulatus]WSU77983.1 hypothetical protein OG499_35750 [Streptomyces anulatus]
MSLTVDAMPSFDVDASVGAATPDVLGTRDLTAPLSLFSRA